jgi:uncharacterized membrane protein YhaH (DUF805 family)
MQRLFRLAFWLALVTSFVMAVLPAPPHVPGSDKTQHILAFMTLAALGSIAYPAWSALSLAFALFGVGALIEFAQMVPSLHRDADMLDWIADIMAVTVVVLAIKSWRMFRANA